MTAITILAAHFNSGAIGKCQTSHGVAAQATTDAEHQATARATEARKRCAVLRRCQAPVPTIITLAPATTDNWTLMSPPQL